MNAKGRVKEDGAFNFYEQESSRRGMSYHARRTTHDARRTTHDPRPTTHLAGKTAGSRNQSDCRIWRVPLARKLGKNKKLHLIGKGKN